LATQAKRSLKFRVLFILLALSLLAAGCVSNQNQAKQISAGRSGGTLNYFLGEPVSIDPAYAVEGEGLEVVKQLFDGLVDYNPKTMEVVPAVAASWHSNKKGDTWTFRLRENARFHNGRTVRAEDFIYAWNRVASKKTASEVAYHLAPIKGFDEVQSGAKQKLSGLSAPEPYVLKVELNYPFADFPKILGHPVFSPVPKEEIEKGVDKFTEKPVGDGPFVMAGPWKHQESIKIKRFDDYYGRPAYLNAVDFQINKDDQTAWLQLQGGSLDYAPIPSGQIEAAKKQFGNNAVVGKPQLILNYYAFNLYNKPFKGNTKLRRAINYAVNRKVIAEKIYEGAFVPAGGIVPPGVIDYKQPENAYYYSKSKAKELLKEAGYPGGKGLPPIKLIYGAGRGHEGPAQIFQENLREIGIKVELKGLEHGAFIKAMMAGETPMNADGWQGDYPSRDSFLYSLFETDSADNYYGYSNKKVDKLLIEARQSEDVKARNKLYNQAEEMILKDAPVVPVTYVGTSYVHAARVNGFIRTVLDDTPLDHVWLAD
jgi:oligopeptide transport system substrate-binding protein